MKRELLLLMSSIFLFIIISCSNDEITPDERISVYVDHWSDHKFEDMYNMLATETLDDYTTEEIINRYEKVYEDLGITNLNITYEELSSDELEAALEEGRTIYPIHVEMDSIAGQISFDYEVTVVQEGEEDDEKDWFVKWDPGLIFPEIKDGGEISIQTETPKRGEILDRNKMPLAINDFVYEIGIVPGRIGSDKKKEIERIAKLLNMSLSAIETHLNADWVEPGLYVPLRNIPQTEDYILSELLQIDSIERREVTGRVYPLNEAAAHLVGYIGPVTAEELEKAEPGTYGSNVMIGKRGLEQLYESELKGESGIKIMVSKDNDNIVLAEMPVTDGENISVTIDATVQEEVYNSYDGSAGTAAAINPISGEALALVSSPGFNPNDFLYGVSQSQREKLEKDPQTPLINRFSATFAPGSAIKPITAAIGLKNETIKPDDGIEIEGLTWDNGEGWGDYKVRRVSESNKPVDLTDALIRSDNIYFAMQAIEMGSKSFVDGLKQFGFEEDLPFAYPLTQSTISSSGTINGEVEIANTSYGQAEIEMSALHLATTYSTFLNEGNMIKPVLLGSEETGQVWKDQLVNADQAKLLQTILRNIVKEGTAQVANKKNLPISGKTGTVELKLAADSDGQENAWFVGYPTDESDLLIAMMVEETKDIGASSHVAEKVAELLIKLK